MRKNGQKIADKRKRKTNKKVFIFLSQNAKSLLDVEKLTIVNISILAPKKVGQVRNGEKKVKGSWAILLTIRTESGNTKWGILNGEY